MPASQWPQPDSELLRRARRGEAGATDQVLNAFRGQLKGVVSARLDSRLAGRFDPSDVVQDVFTVALGSLADWIKDGKPVYACLHRLTRDRLAALRREHVTAQKRTVQKEATGYAELSSDSVLHLCRRLGVREPTPSQQAIRQESQALVRVALASLPEIDREVLVMRILEGAPANEVASVLGITEAAVNMRQLRALERVRKLLEQK